MNTYNLKEEYEKKYNEELNNTGVFWAFSSEQFELGKIPQDAPNNEFCSIGMGGYIHKSNLEKLDNFFNNIAPKLKKEFTEKVDREKYILYELDNHECFYTYDISTAFSVLKDYYNDLTEEEVYSVFKKNQKRRK